MTDLLVPPESFVFADTDAPDTVPPTAHVEFPCRVCGGEAGPYGGHGRKPTLCQIHKKAKPKSSARVTGAPASLAAQAAGVLEQLNGIIAVGCMAMGFNETASAIAAHNEVFKEQAYQALTTDQDLCRLILKGGVKSAKVSLGLAYAGLAIGVVPVATNEFRDKKAVRDAAREEMESASGA